MSNDGKGGMKMKKEQTTIRLPDEVKEFVKFLKSLDEKQQMGLHLTIEGLQLLAEKEKSGKNR